MNRVLSGTGTEQRILGGRRRGDHPAFTLAYGKDIGSAGRGQRQGNLRTYCGTWLGIGISRTTTVEEVLHLRQGGGGSRAPVDERRSPGRPPALTAAGSDLRRMRQKTKTETYRRWGMTWQRVHVETGGVKAAAAEFTYFRCGSSNACVRADGTLWKATAVEYLRTGRVCVYLAVGSIGEHR